MRSSAPSPDIANEFQAQDTSGVFVIDSKQWIGSVHQSPDGLVWHNHYRLDRSLATSAGKPRPLAACSVSPPPPWCACMALT
jgi:hypothetical protein